jgi:hypothetical protein
MISLRQLIEFGSTTAEKIFRRRGCFDPMWHAILADGSHKIIPQTIDDKELQIGLVRAAFMLFDARAYVFISEAWALSGKARDNAERDAKLEQYLREGIRENPDRVEILWLQAEDQTGMLSARRKILRPNNARAKLGELEFDEMQGWSAGGRMMGLLPRPTTARVQ